MGQTWKDILKVIVVNLLAALWTYLTDFEGFPDVSMDMFIALLLWAIGLVIGGWEAKRIHDRALRVRK